ncbi:MAG: hypothetical protein CL534_19190 [Ahrensia sp.]|nr:hypothetical protein [Ahrensia sp.]
MGTLASWIFAVGALVDGLLLEAVFVLVFSRPNVSPRPPSSDLPLFLEAEDLDFADRAPNRPPDLPCPPPMP